MAKAPHLRIASEGDKPDEPKDLLEAVASGDHLAIMKAQRQLIAESLVIASENTRPQYSNELTKLNKAIAEEEDRRAIEDQESSVVVPLESQAWDGTGY